MKQGIHPPYELRTVQCVCGATYQFRTTRDIRKIDICAACHPFFTGKQKYVDSAGRVEKFLRRYARLEKSAAK